MLASEAYDVAFAAGLTLVGVECGSVDIGGGYIQCGGHSMLSTLYGMRADQILEYEVVTADGQHRTATPKKNTDLYQARSGGGGGTFGVLLKCSIASSSRYTLHRCFVVVRKHK